jgi:hypothetical protein
MPPWLSPAGSMFVLLERSVRLRGKVMRCTSLDPKAEGLDGDSGAPVLAIEGSATDAR